MTSSTWVVSYMVERHFRATRHAKGCPTLNRARREYETRQTRVSDLLVLTEPVHRRYRPLLEPKDHVSLDEGARD